MVLAAAIYCRISDDRTGQRAGVQRQEADCRDLAAQRGWSVVEVYVDNDISAYRGKPRPGYRKLLADMKGGRVDAVVVWHLDRLHRHPRELEEFFEAADAAGIRDLATVTGDVDLGSDDGRFHARILGAVARKESDDKARRIRRKHDELAQQGRPVGGGNRPYGFEEDRLTIREDEAALIREATQRILSGESMYGIIRDWDRRGIRTSSGNPWRTYPLKRMLVSGRIAGLREHHGQIAAEAQWPPIIDRDSHDRLRVILTDPTRRKYRGGHARSYLLTGYARCGLCGAKLVARPRADGRRCYVCASGPDHGGCGRIRVVADPLEDLVAEAIVTALDTPKLSETIRAQTENTELSGLLDTLRGDEEALEQLAQDHYVDRIITRGEFLAARDGIQRRIDTTRTQLRQHEATTALADIPSGADAVRRAWHERDLDWRRALVGTVIDQLVVNPAVRGRNRFDPDRLEIRWRA